MTLLITNTKNNNKKNTTNIVMRRDDINQLRYHTKRGNNTMPINIPNTTSSSKSIFK